MPFGEYEDFDACVRENADKRDPEAYCAAIKRQIEGASALSDADKEAIRASDTYNDRLLDDDPCWDGYVMVGTKQENGEVVPNCVPEEDADEANLAAADDRCDDGHVEIGGRCIPVENVDDVPPSSLDMSAPRVMASGDGLDTEPIERDELGDGRVAYRNLKLVDAGVWTDQNSQTPTLYDERTFENTTPDYDSAHDGPPVNIAHDIHKEGPNANEPHEASIAGHIDPDSLRTDGEALFGDVILNTDDSAGSFADDNLKSALENGGTAGFSPSVELMPTELREASGSHAEEHVAAAELTGLGLVRDPASKSVDLRHETRNRAVAMAANGPSDKVRVCERTLMSPEEIRETLEGHGIDTGDMDDDDVMNMAEELHSDLMDDLEAESDDEEEEEEPPEMGDYEDDDEDDEDKDMADDGAIDVLEEQIDDLWDAMDELKEEMATEEEMAELAAAETVDDLDDRLMQLEEQPAESKTLAEGGGEDYEPNYDTSPSAPSNW